MCNLHMVWPRSRRVLLCALKDYYYNCSYRNNLWGSGNPDNHSDLPEPTDTDGESSTAEPKTTYTRPDTTGENEPWLTIDTSGPNPGTGYGEPSLDGFLIQLHWRNNRFELATESLEGSSYCFFRVSERGIQDTLTSNMKPILWLWYRTFGCCRWPRRKTNLINEQYFAERISSKYTPTLALQTDASSPEPLWHSSLCCRCNVKVIVVCPISW